MKYRVRVNKNECIADGICYSMDPDHYEEDDEGKADAVGGVMKSEFSTAEFDDDGYEDAVDTADACPVSAIDVEKL